LRTCWLLLLEEYGVTFEYLSGNKQENMCTFANFLSRFDVDSVNIQEYKEEVLKLLSGSKKQHHQKY
jgi:hypothetical protein